MDDHCTAIELVLQRGPVGETYNVGSGVEATIMEIADRILAASGKPESSRRSSPTARATTAGTCSTRRRSDGSWAGSHGALEQGLADTVAWYAGHRSWWEPLRDRAPVVEGAWGTPEAS